MGRQPLEGKPRAGRRHTAVTEENIAAVRKLVIFFFFEEGRNSLCTVKGTPCPPGVWDSAAHSALPT